MKEKTVIEINSLCGKKYLTKLQRHGEIVLLLGSGISMWSPSNLPSGQTVTQEIAELVAESSVGDKSLIVEMIKSSAFEHIMERYPKPDVLNKIVADAYRPTAPNPVHMAVAELINDGIVKHIVTTNYDEGIENACALVCRREKIPLEIVNESDINSIAADRPILFKIHGSAKLGSEDSIVATLTTEGELPEWKGNLLDDLTKDRILLISGYSGFDFEISPALAGLSFKRLLWNSFDDPRIKPESLSANASHVVRETDGKILVGGMHDMFALLNQKPCSWTGFGSGSSFVEKLKDELMDWELDKWRVWVLNGLSCAKEAIEIGRRMLRNSFSEAMRLDSLLALAEALFHGGYYKQAALIYEDAAKVSFKIRDHPAWVKSELGLIESYRVAGHWLRAAMRIEKLSRRVKPLFSGDDLVTVESQIALKRVLLQRYVFRLSNLFRLAPISRKIQNSVTQDLSTTASYSAINGKWFDLRQCQMLAKKFGIPLANIYAGKMKTTSFREGYRQLGYVLAEMMAIRSEMLDGGLSDISEILPYLDKAEALGINAEYWKLIRTAERRFGREAISHAQKQKTKMFWKECEYNPSMKFLLKFFGENA